MLLKKYAKFGWTTYQEKAFQNLKAKLSSKPILQYPDLSKKLIPTTDASNLGVVSVLSQGGNWQRSAYSIFQQKLKKC
jgi:hypothetical protein